MPEVRNKSIFLPVTVLHSAFSVVLQSKYKYLANLNLISFFIGPKLLTVFKSSDLFVCYGRNRRLSTSRT